MKSQQSGFTLVEIAIVLVIIGLLLGGILKGQELINSAKVKNFANDFRAVPTYIYGYQDKYRALPGDDVAVVAHLGSAATAATVGTKGNGLIEGNWNSAAVADESFVFWQHVRLAQIAPGVTDTGDAANFQPRNAAGGRLGVSSATPGLLQISGMLGTYQVCSAAIIGKLAKQIDTQLDDGNPATGNVRAVPDASPLATAAMAIDPDSQDANPYTVCMTF